MIKKIVCAALMLALLATSSMGAFAAVTATTTYDGTDIIVTSVVEGVEAGDTITYLAYEPEGGEGPTDTNIAYIDQILVDAEDSKFVDGKYTITYKADPKFVGATVLQGGLGFDSVSNATIQNYVEYCVVTVTVDSVALAPVSVEKQDAAATGFVEIACASVPATVTIGGEAVVWYPTANGFMIPAAKCSGATLAISITTGANNATGVTTDKIGKDAQGKMVVANVNGSSDDFGVLMVSAEAGIEDEAIVVSAATEPGVDADFNAETLYKYKAGAKGNDGSYMIKVEGITTGKYLVKAYAKVGDEYVYGKLATLDLDK